ncbi:hypothetical protein ACLKMH_18715 [Psychromonas sp. KJ10-10]|uniref:hypothetical protein n=1 Tax=Psychromonas sp. KJ10-10 TaxID=3391823 RepID=UPI0039B46222
MPLLLIAYSNVPPQQPKTQTNQQTSPAKVMDEASKSISAPKAVLSLIESSEKN